MSKGGDKEDAIFFVGNSWLKPWIANSSTSSLFLLLPLPHSLKRWKVVESPPPPVPTSFALRASTMTLIELGSITKNKHPVSFILKTWQTWNPAFCSCSNMCIFPWKANSSHFGTKLYRFDQSHQRDIIPEVGHGKSSMHDYFVDVICNTVSLNLVRPYWMN